MFSKINVITTDENSIKYDKLGHKIAFSKDFFAFVSDFNIIQTIPNKNREYMVVPFILSFLYEDTYYFLSVSRYSYKSFTGKIDTSHTYQLGYLLSIIRIYLEDKKVYDCKYGMIFREDGRNIDNNIHNDGYIKFCDNNKYTKTASTIITNGYDHFINESTLTNLKTYNQAYICKNAKK